MTIKVHQALLADNINGYSNEGATSKAAFHTQGKKFLKELDAVLNPNGDHAKQIRSNLGGVAVSGEVTLHSEHMYVQISEHATSRGLSIMYRTCDGLKDYSGHTNNFISMRDFANPDRQDSVIATMLKMIDREVERIAEKAGSQERQRG